MLHDLLKRLGGVEARPFFPLKVEIDIFCFSHSANSTVSSKKALPIL